MHKTNQPGIALVAIIISAVIALSAGGAAAYYFTDGFGTKKSDNSTAEQAASPDSKDTQSDQTNESATGADTLPLVKAAIAGKTSLKCTSNTKIDDKYAVATMYIKNKDNVRLNIRTDMGTVNTILKDQAYSYTWSEGQDRGSKFALSKDDLNIDKQWQNNLNDAKKDSNLKGISCDQTAVDDALFVVPENVTFSGIAS